MACRGRGATATAAQMLVGCILMLIASNTAAIADPNPAVEPDADIYKAFRTALQNLQERPDSLDPTSASALAQAVVDDPLFENLTISQRVKLLKIAGALAFKAGEHQRVLTNFRRGTEVDGSDAALWTSRLQAALNVDDIEDAMSSLTTIARNLPAAVLKGLRTDGVSGLLETAAKHPALTRLRFPLLDTLFDAQWRNTGNRSPDDQWRALVLHHLEAGRAARAQQVAAGIESLSERIGMRADRRYAALVETMPGHFDIERAAARRTVAAQQAIVQSPRSLSAVVDLLFALQTERRYDEVLSLSAAVIHQIDGAEPRVFPYDDIHSMLIWVFEARARACKSLGRFDDAIAILERAAVRPEHGSFNVSQRLNLGLLLTELDRPEDARAAIRDVKDVNDFGERIYRAVELQSAVAQGDHPGIARALAALRSDPSNSKGLLYQTLLWANDLDAAADVLIERLEDPDDRFPALVSLQDYRLSYRTPRLEDIEARNAAVLSRHDVQQALREAGVIHTYPIEEPLE